jgi:hypothetical protein
VREGEATLAEAEVWLVKSQSEANALKGQKLAAVPGLPYLIKFRIEEGQSPPPPALRVTIDPTAATLVPGESFPLTAAVVTTDGQTVPDAVIIWSSSAAQTALVSPAGIVQAVALGSVDITAASPGAVSASAAIIVGALPLPRSATIGTAGGSLSTPLADGGTLDLVVPAGAVGEATAFTLEPLQRGRSARSFRFTPASRIFNLPIRFTYTPPTGVGTANLYLGWRGDLGRRAIALEPDGPSLRVTGTARIIGDLPELPPIPAVSTPSARAAELVAGDGSIDISCWPFLHGDRGGGPARARSVHSDPSFDNADDPVFVMDRSASTGPAGFDPEGTVLLNDWRGVVCSNFTRPCSGTAACR